MPLAQTSHKHSSIPEKDTDAAAKTTASDHSGDDWANGLTLEKLRAEVDSDLAAGDQNTAYDRTSIVKLKLAEQ